MGKFDIRPNLCSRVIFASSKCQKCFSVCPADAMRIDDQSVQVTPACTGCEFCSIVCPNGVFHIKDATNQSESDSGSPQCIYCSKVIPDEQEALGPFPKVIKPCIGSISAHEILNWISEKNGPLKLVTMNCSQCEMQIGVSIFENTKSEVMSILLGLGMNNELFIIQEATEKDRVYAREVYSRFQNDLQENQKFSRRDFFLSFRKGLIPKKDSGGAGIVPPRAEKSPPERLRAFIAFCREHQCKVSPEYRVPLFAVIEIADTCKGCGACATVCPTGALSVMKEQDKAHLTLTPSHCAQCGLCAEVCSRDSIKVMPGLKIKEICDETKAVVKTFHRNTCPVCNREHLSLDLDADCPFCRKERTISDHFSTMIYRDAR
jgi:formate hydrogenlyase subunit 6/NADH:ubiquinone oxidoreductase subunit I